ncbi:unnamed protein product, partial [Caretta caretta]
HSHYPSSRRFHPSMDPATGVPSSGWPGGHLGHTPVQWPFYVTCGAPPEVTNAIIINNEEGRYLPGARVQYKCQEGFESMGLNDVTCEDGEWSQPPTCQATLTTPPPDVFTPPWILRQEYHQVVGQEVIWGIHLSSGLF